MFINYEEVSTTKFSQHNICNKRWKQDMVKW